MQILHVGKFYYPNRGGMETVLRTTAEGLVQAGHQVSVLCSSKAAREEHHVIDGVRVIRAGTLGSVLSQPLCPALGKHLRREAAGVDLVHVHSPNPLAEYAALKLPAEIPLVATYHADVVRQRLVLPAYRPLIRKFLDRCDKIVVATEQHIEYSPTLAPYADKCEVVPFGMDPARFVPTARVRRRTEQLRQRHGEFVLFVGRLVGYKGLPHLLEAMRDLPQQLLIIGAGPLAGRLAQQAARLGMADRVHLLGSVADDLDLLAYYHACRLLALPSTTPAEAFGMVLLEAMACGKPLVTSKLRSGVVHVNQHGVNGLHAEPGNSASLQITLDYLLRDDELSAQLGAEGRRRFTAEFTTTAMIKRLTEVYAECAGAKTTALAPST